VGRPSRDMDGDRGEPEDASPERGTKHGSRVDEEMKKEFGAIPAEGSTEERDEFRHMEGLTDDDPSYDRTSGSPPGANLSVEEAEKRSDLARAVRSATFPTDKHALVEAARSDGAPDREVQMLGRLPDGRRFENFQEVWEALGGSSEERD